eukprot:92163_1
MIVQLISHVLKRRTVYIHITSRATMGNSNQSKTTDSTRPSNKDDITLGTSNLHQHDVTFLDTCLLSRCKYNVSQLVQEYPCRFNHPHKRTIYQNITKHQTKKGKIDPKHVCYFTRWKQLNMTNDDKESKQDNPLRKTNTVHSYEENVFEYNEKKSDNNEVTWYLNFAHSNLFIAYAGVLLAQDELQVLEHPFLGSLRECMVRHNKAAKEKVEFLSRVTAYSTPCLFTGVPRQCHVDTLPNKHIKGREGGLYGNAFCRCKDFSVIDGAVRLLTPVTHSNIIAIEAPTGGYGTYSLKDIDYIFLCAFTAFKAARIESEILCKKNKNDEVNVVIHSGNWGTGAYGGNKELMSLLQILAADFSGVDRLVYHTFSKMFTAPYLKALEVRQRFVDKDGNIVEDWAFIRNELFQMNYRWGVSDGN